MIIAALTSAGLITTSINYFRDYQVDCPRAFDRLIHDGVPATIMHGSNISMESKSDGKIVAETVQAFITAMDCLRLSQRATDEIQPLISELTSSLNKSGLPSDFDGLIKMKMWLQKLNNMRASEEIGEEDARQLSFDLENSYNSFHDFLAKK